MDAHILHSGFDGLKFTSQSKIPPALHEMLASAKAHAKTMYSDCVLDFGAVKLNVTNKGARGYTAHTGEHGAVWMFQDPEDPIPNNPAITIDFRALGLATGGLEAAEEHFRTCMLAFGIPYVETQLRVARADFAVDFLAPWFEPDRGNLVVPPKTKVTEYTGVDETATVSSGGRVTGLRAGAVANRQIAIYDKRAEVIQSRKLGWLTIWNAARKDSGHAPIDLKDRDSSQVWRFELRLGAKQLRNKFDLRSWDDIMCVIGDAFTDATSRIRYCEPSNDCNRARWPVHSLWRLFETVIASDLMTNCCGVLPSDVISANRISKMREIDAQLCGLFINRAAISGVQADEFEEFMESHSGALMRICDEHPQTVGERLAKVQARYRLDG